MCAMRTMDVRRRDRNQVAALANGMRAIEAFAASRQRMTLAEVAKHSGLTRAAARRYLLTLVANGYANFDGKRFQLTSRVLRLGHAYISSVPLPQIAQPVVEELGHRTDESIALSVLEVNESLTIASSAPRRIVGIFTRVGTHLPALSTATGRVLLAGKTDDVVREMLRRAPVLWPFTSMPSPFSVIGSAARSDWSSSEAPLATMVPVDGSPSANGLRTPRTRSLTKVSVTMLPPPYVLVPPSTSVPGPTLVIDQWSVAESLLILPRIVTDAPDSARVAVVIDVRIVEEGSADTIFTAPRESRTKAFVAQLMR